MALTLSKEALNGEKAGQWFDRLQSLQIARRLGLMLGAAVEHCRAEGNLLLNYSELPAAMSGHLFSILNDPKPDPQS